MNEASSSLECGVCSDVFSDDHCPRILPCSHTFCSRCIATLISTQNKTCPLCREGFRATSAEDLIINRLALDVANQLRLSDAGASASSRGPKKSFVEFTKDFRERYTKKVIADCEKAEFQILDSIDSYKRIKDVALGANEAMERLNQKLEERDIDNDIKLLTSELCLLKRKKEKFKTSDEKLESAANFVAAEPTIDEIETDFDDVQMKMKEIQEFISKKGREINDFEKDIIEMKTRLDNIADEIQMGEGKNHPVDITVSYLRKLCGTVQKITQREIFAVKCGDKLRVASLKIGSNNQVFMSHLEEREIQPKTLTIQVESLMEISTRRAFLDLGIDGTFIGRIIIKVMDDGNKALNFLHMCSGDLGPSYAKSRVTRVDGKGSAGEGLVMGEYETEGGASGKGVLPGIDWKREEQRFIYKDTSLKAGQVRGTFSEDYASVFALIINDNPLYKSRRCFGMVEEGLDVVRDAISRYPDIKKIMVIDCGLIFSL